MEDGGDLPLLLDNDDDDLALDLLGGQPLMVAPATTAAATATATGVGGRGGVYPGTMPASAAMPRGQLTSGPPHDPASAAAAAAAANRQQSLQQQQRAQHLLQQQQLQLLLQQQQQQQQRAAAAAAAAAATTATGGAAAAASAPGAGAASVRSSTSSGKGGKGGKGKGGGTSKLKHSNSTASLEAVEVASASSPSPSQSGSTAAANQPPFPTADAGRLPSMELPLNMDALGKMPPEQLQQLDVEVLMALQADIAGLLEQSRARRLALAKEYTRVVRWHERVYGAGVGSTSLEAKRKLSIDDPALRRNSASGASSSANRKNGNKNKRKRGALSQEGPRARARPQAGATQAAAGAEAAPEAPPIRETPVEDAFWAEIESYVRFPSKTDMKLLNMQIEDRKLRPSMARPPALGRHYSELLREYDCEVALKAGTGEPIRTGGVDATGRLRLASASAGQQCGPLTKRLLAALVDADDDLHKRIGVTAALKQARPDDAQPPPHTDFAATEKGLHHSLAKLGLVDRTAMETDGPDEILEDLLRTQRRTEEHMEHCSQLAQRLLRTLQGQKANVEMYRRSFDNDIRKIDKQIEDLFAQRMELQRRSESPPAEMLGRIETILNSRDRLMADFEMAEKHDFAPHLIRAVISNAQLVAAAAAGGGAWPVGVSGAAGAAASVAAAPATANGTAAAKKSKKKKASAAAAADTSVARTDGKAVPSAAASAGTPLPTSSSLPPNASAALNNAAKKKKKKKKATGDEAAATVAAAAAAAPGGSGSMALPPAIAALPPEQQQQALMHMRQQIMQQQQLIHMRNMQQRLQQQQQQLHHQQQQQQQQQQGGGAAAAAAAAASAAGTPMASVLPESQGLKLRLSLKKE